MKLTGGKTLSFIIMYRKTVIRAMPGKEKAIARESFGGRGGSRGGHGPSRGSDRFGRSSRGPRGTVNARKHRSFSDESKFINKAKEVEEEIYTPVHTFADFKIGEDLKAAIIARGFVTPTPIQDQAIPHVLEGRDIVGLANTGTGKTAAFLIPLLEKILNDRKQKVIILAPTRELAIQIERDLEGVVKGRDIYAVCCVGGAPLGPQMRMLGRRHNFVIGTPGRVKDLMDRGCINLSQFNTIVLDEADRMLDMGFINDMKFVMGKMPSPRHTLFFSATLSPEIKALISQFLNDPVMISVKTRDTAQSIDQDVVRVKAGEQKIDKLHELLKDPEFSKVLVFGRTKHGVERLSNDLVKRGVASESIHGDKGHSQRQRALGKFKEDKVQVLIATDVAARGLHIDNVSHVINFDLPESYEDYVHRIGRTGRAGKKGKALTFIEERAPRSY